MEISNSLIYKFTFLRSLKKLSVDNFDKVQKYSFNFYQTQPITKKYIKDVIEYYFNVKVSNVKIIIEKKLKKKKIIFSLKKNFFIKTYN